MNLYNLIAKIQGNQIPYGEVKVSGAKNAATRLLAASLISDEEVVLTNFPTELVDVKHKIDFIEKSGGEITIDSKSDKIFIDSSELKDVLLEAYDFPIRTTYLLVPGLIKKTGRAKIPYPGGCKIGNRGYDLHVMAWQKFGAEVIEKENHIEVIANKGFQAAEINFPISTIGGTETALICASIAKGTSVIKNAYISPEVDSLILFLKTLGVEITVVGNSYIQITGKKELKGSYFEVLPDRIEALTWIVYGILSQGKITIKDVPFADMEIPMIHLENAGIDLYRSKNNIYVSPECLLNGKIQPFEVATGTHPGIISDMQPFYTLLGLHANGISRIFDYRYPERVKYCEELNKFYPGKIEWKTGKIITKGTEEIKINSAKAKSTDLRGSMAAVIAALLANGLSEIKNVEMALRGYNKLEEKLKNLGVKIEIHS